MTELEKAKQETAFWHCILSGLSVNYLMLAQGGSDLITEVVDMTQPGAANKVYEYLFYAAIPSGAYAEAGLSLDDVQCILKEIGAPDAVAQWENDMRESCEQNRRFIEADESERAKWN